MAKLNKSVCDLMDVLADMSIIADNKCFSLSDKVEQDAVFEQIASISMVRETTGEYYTAFKNSRDFVVHFLKDRHYSPQTPNTKNKEATGITYIPYEIKVLIWYMSYRAMEIYDSLNLNGKKSANNIIRNFTTDFLGTKRASTGITNQFMLDIFVVDSDRKTGFTFSKKTLQDFALSPSRYYEASHYKEIEMINSYAGEKKGVFARALRYIVSFARDYDNFLDLFGGSGRASMVVPKVDGVDYYINEWDFRNINYFTVMQDDNLYSKLRTYIASIQDLLRKSATPAQDSLNIYKNSKALLFTTSPKFNSKIPQTFDLSGRVLQQVAGDRKITNEDRELYAKAFPSINSLNYNNMSDDDKVELAVAFIYFYSFTGSGGSSMEKASTDINKIVKFYNYNLKNLDLAHKEFARLRKIYNADALNYGTFLIDTFMNKPSRRYEEFASEIEALQEGKQVDISDDKLKYLVNRLGGTSKKLPRNFRTLIYSDSPYLHTSGYGDARKCVSRDDIYSDGSISESSMKKLITRLMLSYEAGNDFIFSCRAGDPKQAGYLTHLDNKLKKIDSSVATLESMGITKLSDIFDVTQRSDENHSIFFDSIKIKDTSQDATASLIADLRNIFATNYAIYDVVFYSFEALAHIMDKPLYILVGLNDGVDLKEALTELQVIEVFITSIETPSLPLGLVGDTNYRFEAYTISEFNDILRNNMLMSLYSKGWKLEPYADYSDSPDGKIYKQRTKIVVSEAELAQKEKEGK